MNSIQLHSSFSSLLSQNNQQFNTHRLLSLHSTQEPKRRHRFPHIKSRAATITSSLILAETAPFKGGDLSVLLPTGGLMLFMYFITNYLVPAFIIKGYENDEDETEDFGPKNGGD
ncbi:hypothetical protein M5689_014342 [Euphorbia peplus]|nr:hypothetical protein M5689_014342 [Euphorbia peplus]